MRKPFRTITLSALVVTAVSAMSNAEAWSFGTQMRSTGGDYRGYGAGPQPSGPSGGFSFACGFSAHCLPGGSSFGPSINYVPPTYGHPSYAPGFYNGYEDGYYRGYYDGNRSRYGRGHKRFR